MPAYLSPAKVNLFLEIQGRRPDGFHQLSSLFQTITLFDTLHLDFSPCSDSFKTDHASLSMDASNLVVKAVALFRQKTGLLDPLDIRLEKNIPMEAGLGGGSSNAATTLWALNTLYGSPIEIETLLLWSKELGSDVPFFLSKGTALCKGRGEEVMEIAPLMPQMGWIVKPPFGLSTPAVYGALDLKTLPKRKGERALEEIIKGKLSLFNDLESPAFFLSPALGHELLALPRRGW